MLKSRNVSHRGQHGVREPGRRARTDRPGQAERRCRALAEGVRGQGERIGQATTDANQVLLALNPRRTRFAQDWRALEGFSDAYGAAAQDILADARCGQHHQHDDHRPRRSSWMRLLLNTIGFSHRRNRPARAEPGQPDRGDQRARADHQPAAQVQPEYTCLLVGAKCVLDNGRLRSTRRQRSNARARRRRCLLGDDPYHYPDNLPIVGAKGGPGGKPGCGSLPDVAKNFPVRQLVTNTGFGTGHRHPAEPRHRLPVLGQLPPGHPGGAGAAEHPQPVRRACAGPIPYPGAPPYGATSYGPDGTPLWPGLPPAPPPMRHGTGPHRVPNPSSSRRLHSAADPAAAGSTPAEAAPSP